MSVDSRPETVPSTFSAVVNTINHRWIELDQSQFHPETSERESDHGRIQDIPVVKVGHNDHGLVHWVDLPAATRDLHIGQIVRCQIDWERRDRLERLHSLLHLSRLALEQQAGPATRVRGEVTPAASVLEMILPPSAPQPRADDLRRWIEEIVGEDLDISLVATPHGAVWYVDGVGTEPSCGSHPPSTGAIGSFALATTCRATGVVQVTTTLVSD